MKKISMFFLAAAVLLISVFPTAVFAETSDTYDAVISAPETATIDEVIEVTASVRNINVAPGLYTTGVLTTSITLLFDSGVFEFVEDTAVIPATFEYFENVTEVSSGKCIVFTSWDKDPFEGVLQDDEIVFTFKLKVISIPASCSTTITLTDVQGSNGSMVLFNGKGSEAVVNFEAFLPKDNSGLKLEKEKNYIISTVSNVKAADFRKLFKKPASSLYMIENEVSVMDNELVVSGMAISDGTDTYTVIVLGDIDFDGVITANDYTAVKMYFKGSIPLAGLALESADIDENGRITTSDYLRIRRKIAGNYEFTF